MASKIRVLSEHTINKIAAGEVIENPSSVVKELVENSLDAGATEICIEIKGGGRQLIRITDNGCGMNADDAILCLERHATSKIKEVEEIEDLSTMGFRGEAIPSIASISKFTLLTCTEANEHSSGTMVIVEGGKLISCSPAACSKGTTIEVKSLFFNVPVRRKFMKSPSIDANEILKIVSLISLGYPQIKFLLINDGKQALSTSPITETSFIDLLKARISTIIGPDFLQNTVHLELKENGFEIRGVIGTTAYTRHNRSGQYLYINQRPVSSHVISYAVKEGYGTALPDGRHPVFVLHLTLPGEFVDVNVHPQKKEVRLRHESTIREMIVKAVTASLHTSPSFISTKTTPVTIDTPSPVFAKAWETNVESRPNNKAAWTFTPKPTFQPPTPKPLPEWLATSSKPSEVQTVNSPPMEFLPLPAPSIASPRALATILNYIIVDSSTLPHKDHLKDHGGLTLVDQRAAHCRILFEKLTSQKTDEMLPQQMLLIPHQLEVSPFEAETLRTSLPVLNRMGIHIREFGPRNFLVDAIPQFFGKTNLEMLLAEIINDIRSAHFQHDDKQIYERERIKQVALAASRAALSNNRRLSLVEAQSLLDQLHHCEQPIKCPSGKSTFVHLSGDELAKLFQKG